MPVVDAFVYPGKEEASHRLYHFYYNGGDDQESSFFIKKDFLLRLIKIKEAKKSYREERR